jgi:hypothetical protein
LEDPRQLKNVLYPLSEILLLILYGVIFGSETWVDIVEYGEEKLSYLRDFASFEKGVTSHDTPGEVFSNLDPKSFQTCFIAWTASVQEASREIVAIDG